MTRKGPHASGQAAPAWQQAGAAAVEMAIIMPLLVMLLFGTAVFGLQLFRSQSMQAAAHEGGRLASIGATYDAIAQRALAEQKVAGALADLDVDVTRGATSFTGSDVACEAGAIGELVEVSVAVATPANYALTIPFFGPVGPDFSSVAVFRCE